MIKVVWACILAMGIFAFDYGYPWIVDATYAYIVFRSFLLIFAMAMVINLASTKHTLVKYDDFNPVLNIIIDVLVAIFAYKLYINEKIFASGVLTTAVIITLMVDIVGASIQYSISRKVDE